jgi:hypothetical protein
VTLRAAWAAAVRGTGLAALALATLALLPSLRLLLLLRIALVLPVLLHGELLWLSDRVDCTRTR